MDKNYPCSLLLFHAIVLFYEKKRNKEIPKRNEKQTFTNKGKKKGEEKKMNSDYSQPLNAEHSSSSHIAVESLATSLATRVVSLEHELQRLTALQSKLKADEEELLRAVRHEEEMAVAALPQGPS